MKKNQYILESDAEFDRLEHQSRMAAYDYRDELARLGLPERAKVLDAGCGSGVVTRYLAQKFFDAQVIGCDFYGPRVVLARDACRLIPSVRIDNADICALGYKDGEFDAIVCRYVLQHLPREGRLSALSEMRRCLKPGGILHIIEADGFIENLFPMPESSKEMLALCEEGGQIDFSIGRKLPAMMGQSGLELMDFNVKAVQFTRSELDQEKQMMAMRFEACFPYLSSLVGPRKARLFVNEYLGAFGAPGAVYFYNRVIAQASKPAMR